MQVQRCFRYFLRCTPGRGSDDSIFINISKKNITKKNVNRRKPADMFARPIIQQPKMMVQIQKNEKPHANAQQSHDSEKDFKQN
jgi:hypothetical protein